jgi:hypothetical protein
MTVPSASQGGLSEASPPRHHDRGGHGANAPLPTLRTMLLVIAWLVLYKTGHDGPMVRDGALRLLTMRIRHPATRSLHPEEPAAGGCLEGWATSRHTSSFSRRNSSEFCKHVVPQEAEGAGNAGCFSQHPRPRVRMGRSTRAVVATGESRITGTPCAMVLRFPSCSPRRPGFVASVMREAWPHAFDTCLGVSGPHDFAVRAQHRSSVDVPRPSHPAPNTRDDREAPLFSGAGRGELVEMICPTGIAEYFC